MRSEFIFFDHISPVNIDPFRTLRVRADTILPVIIIREASPRPAYDRRANGFQSFDHIIANAFRVGN